MSRITKRASNRICYDCAESAGRLRETILGECFIDERRVTERHDPISRAPVCGVCGLEKTHSFEFVEMPKPVVYRVPLQLTIFLSAGAGAIVAVIVLIGFLGIIFYFGLLDKLF